MKATDRICNDISIAAFNFARNAAHPAMSEPGREAMASHARDLADRIIAVRTLGEQVIIFVAECILHEDRGQLIKRYDEALARNARRPACPEETDHE